MCATPPRVRLCHRVAVVGLVVVCVVGMGVHYDATYDTQWPYPTEDDLATDYDTHVGQETFLIGKVVAADGGSARIRVDSDAGAYSLRVRSFDAAVEPGGVVQVLGTVRPDGVLVAARVAVVSPSPGAQLYKYGVSVTGAALVLIAFFRRWRLDTDRPRLVTRDG